MSGNSKNLKILVIHGPNLNLLGEREPEIYGSLTLCELDKIIREHALKSGVDVRIFQSNHEGEIIDFIHENRNWAKGIVINPASLTHYSYSLRDALAAVNLPVVEVHLSDIKKREEFRRISVIEPVVVKQISGFGWRSYIKGMELLIDVLKS